MNGVTQSLFAFAISLALAAQARAEVLVLYGAQLTKVYTQSRLDSTAHLVQVNQTLSSACNANRLYIDLADKELYASALANHLSGRTVDLILQTDAAPKSAAGHIGGLTCRMISIF